MINHAHIISSLKFLLNKENKDIVVKKEFSKKIKFINEYFLTENEKSQNELIMVNLEQKMKMIDYIIKNVVSSKDVIDYDNIITKLHTSKYKNIYESLEDELNFDNFNEDNFKNHVDSVISWIKIRPVYESIENFNSEISNYDSELEIPDRLNELIKNAFYTLNEVNEDKESDEFMLSEVSLSTNNINKILRKNGQLKKVNKKVRSGFPQLDFCLSGGFESGRIYIVAATPGLGKSISLVNYLFNGLNNTSPFKIDNSDRRLTQGRTVFNDDVYNRDIEVMEDSLFIYFTFENRVNESLDRYFALLLNRDATKTERINKYYDEILSTVYKVGKEYQIELCNEFELDIFKCLEIYKKIVAHIKRGNNKLIDGVPTLEVFSNLLNKIFGKENVEYNKITFVKLLAGYCTYFTHMIKLLENQNNFKNDNEIIYLRPYSASVVDLSMKIDEALIKHPGKKLRAVYVDYLDLMKSMNKTEQYRLELGYITSELKSLGVKYNVPIITATQLNGEGYRGDKSPKLSAITESKKKVEHADFIALMSQSASDVKRYMEKLRTKVSNISEDDNIAFDDYDPKAFGYNLINFDIQKNRSGKVKNIKQVIDYAHMAIYDEYSFDVRDHNNQDNYDQTTRQRNIYDIISDLVKQKIDIEQGYMEHDGNFLTFDVQNQKNSVLIDSFYSWF